MNIRKIVTYNALRKEFTAEELVLADTLYNASETDRELLIQSLQPEKATKKAGKKSATTREYDHCLRCGTTKRDSSHKDQTSPDYHEFQSATAKSARAASLAQQIKSTGKAPRCTYEVDGNGGLMPCDALADNAIHDKDASYLGYHEFQPPQAQTATGE
jgi:hypothetical protein